MKTQSFLLLLYFFVVQTAVIGYLRDNEKLYILSIINLIFLIIYQLISFLAQKGKKEAQKETKTIEENKTTIEKNTVKENTDKPEKISLRKKIHNFCKNYFFATSIFTLLFAIIGKIIFNYSPRIILLFVVLFFITMIIVWKDIIERKVHFGRKLFLPKDYLFWISIVLTSFVYSNLGAIILGSRILIATIIGFLFFAICILSLRLIGSYRFKKLGMTRFYTIVLIIGIGLTSYQFYTGVSKDKLIGSRDQRQKFAIEYTISGINKLAESIFGSGIIIIKQSTTGGNDLVITNTTGNDLVYTGQGNVIGGNNGSEASGYVEEILNTTGEVLSGDILENTGTLVNTGNITNSGTVTTGEVVNTEVTNTGISNVEIKPVKLIDALINLIKVNNTPLVYTKDIRFIRVSQRHYYYKYFRTGYGLGLIGKKTNPDKQVLCENYIIMKGTFEKREVTSNTQDAYRQKATELDKLNGCEKGQYLNTNNL